MHLVVIGVVIVVAVAVDFASADGEHTGTPAPRECLSTRPRSACRLWSVGARACGVLPARR